MYNKTTIAVTANQKRGRRTSLITREKDRKRQAEYRKQRRYNHTEAAKKCFQRKRVQAFILLGGKCENCSDNRYEALEIDHINNNGAAERQFGRGHKIINRVFVNPFDYQLLCGSCHNLKTKGALEADAEFRRQ